ncbi:hypothetical protein GCM10010406_50710 [Streptomyces thermolineatus]|uniref:Cyanobacterial TRADD-N associated 2 transmembrane domain-containing protein n=1 Tax=Streptomyces thermolineatus TaxID=44033 RepID=A0ABN3MTV9_9ACTN
MNLLSFIAAGVFVSAFRGDYPLEENLKIVSSVAAVTGLANAILFLRDDQKQVAESRQRVRAAEQDLEEALRSRATATDLSHGAVVTGGTLHGAALAGPDAFLHEEDAGRSNPARLALPELWKVTHGRLDMYHGIATRQANHSFRNAQFAMLTGFVLLVVFVVIALNASTTAGAVVAGGLGAVAAALAGYVSHTFVRSQESAAAHLRSYFDQPLEFARYLAAERLIQDSELDSAQRAEVLTALVQAMVAGPQPPPDATGQQLGAAGASRPA